MNRLISRRLFLTAALAVATSAVAPFTSPAFAHEADCPVCTLPVVQDTAQQDNEVKVRYGRKRIEYRCVFCAFTDAQAELTKSDLVIAAPSEKKGEPVVIKRTDGKWTTEPGVVFAAQKASHRVCQITYRAFHSRDAFSAYVKAHADQFAADAKPLTLQQMVKLTAPK